MHRKSSKIHIFRNGTCKHRLQLLVHHGYAVFHRFIRIVDFHFLPIQKNFPLIHLVNTKKALHQSGFSCSIFPHEGMNRSRTDRKLYIIQRFNTRK